MISLSKVSTMDSNYQYHKKSPMQNRVRKPRAGSANQKKNPFLRLTQLIAASNQLAHSALQTKMNLQNHSSLKKKRQARISEEEKNQSKSRQATEYWKRKTRNLINKIKDVNIEDAQLGQRKEKNSSIARKKPKRRSEAQMKKEQRLDRLQAKLSNIQNLLTKEIEKRNEDQGKIWNELRFLRFQVQSQKAKDRFGYQIEFVESENRSRSSEESQP